MAPDPYEVLSVRKAATRAEIEAAYERLAEIYRPDRYSSIAGGGRTEAQKKMTEITIARDALLARRKLVPGRPQVTIARRDLFLLIFLAVMLAIAVIVLVPKVI